MDKKGSPAQLNSSNLIVFAFAHWKPLMVISAVAFVVSIIISLLITPLYKSSVVMFPASSVSIS